VDKCDLIVFPDCLNADLQVYLESKKLPRMGSRMGANLELDRIGAKKILKEAGLPVQPFKAIKASTSCAPSCSNVRTYFIKISTYRGDMETFHHVNYLLTEARLDELAFRLGSIKDDALFWSRMRLTRS